MQLRNFSFFAFILKYTAAVCSALFLCIPQVARADADGDKLLAEVQAKVRAMTSGTIESPHFRLTFQRPDTYEIVYNGTGSTTVNDGKMIYGFSKQGEQLLVDWVSPSARSFWDFYLTGDSDCFTHDWEVGPAPQFRPQVEYRVGSPVDRDGQEYRVLEIHYKQNTLTGKIRQSTRSFLVTSEGVPIVWPDAKYTEGYQPRFDHSKLDFSRAPLSPEASKRALNLGDQIKDYAFLNQAGKEVLISSIWSKHKATVIAVIDPTCFMCHLELAYLAYLKQQLGTKGLGLVTVTRKVSPGAEATAEKRVQTRGAFEKRINQLYGETLAVSAEPLHPGLLEKDLLPPLPKKLDYPVLYDPAALIATSRFLAAMSDAEISLHRSSFWAQLPGAAVGDKNLTLVVDNQGKIIYYTDAQLSALRGFTQSFRNSLLGAGVEAGELPVINPN